MKKNHLIKDKKGLQLSSMIIGLLLTISLTAGLFIWLSNGITGYDASPPSGYNQSFLKIQDAYGDLSQNVNQTYNELQDISSETGGNSVTDFLGFFFGAAYRSANIAAQTIGSMFSIGDSAVDSIPLGEYGNLLKGLLFLGIIVVFAIGILLNFVIKSGRE
jgi:hypothetical protein